MNDPNLWWIILGWIVVLGTLALGSVTGRARRVRRRGKARKGPPIDGNDPPASSGETSTSGRKRT